jgi:hypothetical protein
LKTSSASSLTTSRALGAGVQRAHRTRNEPIGRIAHDAASTPSVPPRWIPTRRARGSRPDQAYQVQSPDTTNPDRARDSANESERISARSSVRAIPPRIQTCRMTNASETYMQILNVTPYRRTGRTSILSAEMTATCKRLCDSRPPR